jgi:hypothetical protein
MRRFCTFSAAVLILTASHAPASRAQGQKPNAAEILRSCGMPPGSNDYANCSSYINGVITGVLMDQIAKEQGTPICFPDRVTTEQVRQNVSAFLKAHPNIWTADGNTAMGVALMAIYPCKNSN